LQVCSIDSAIGAVDCKENPQYRKKLREHNQTQTHHDLLLDRTGLNNGLRWIQVPEFAARKAQKQLHKGRKSQVPSPLFIIIFLRLQAARLTSPAESSQQATMLPAQMSGQSAFANEQGEHLSPPFDPNGFLNLASDQP